MQQLPRGARQESVGDRRFDSFGFENEASGFPERQPVEQKRPQQPKYRFKIPKQPQAKNQGRVSSSSK